MKTLAPCKFQVAAGERADGEEQKLFPYRCGSATVLPQQRRPRTPTIEIMLTQEALSHTADKRGAATIICHANIPNSAMSSVTDEASNHISASTCLRLIRF
eukprot:9606709-Karenia_brevis.AAC.1